MFRIILLILAILVAGSGFYLFQESVLTPEIDFMKSFLGGLCIGSGISAATIIVMDYMNNV